MTGLLLFGEVALARRGNKLGERAEINHPFAKKMDLPMES